MTLTPNPKEQPASAQTLARSAGTPSAIAASSDDEIDLVELGVGIWRQRKLIVGITLLCLALATAFALLRPKQYEYSAAIQLGSIADAQGQLQPVVNPDSALTLLNKVVLPSVIDEYSKAHGIAPQDLKVEATLAGSIVLAGKASLVRGADVSAIENAAVDQLAKLTSSQMQSRLSVLKQQLAIANGELQILQAALQPAAGGAAKGDGALQFLNQSNILTQKTLIATLEGQIQSAQPTHLLSNPVRSPEPVGASRAVIVVLGGILGVFFALFAALMSGYLTAIRQRLPSPVRMG